MNLTQRQVIFGVLFIQGVGALLALIVELFGSRDPLMLLVAAGSLTVISGLTVAYARGWEYTRYLLVLFLTGMIVLTASEQFLRDQVTLAVFIPALVALIVASPLWVVVAALGTYGGLIIRAGGSGAYSDVLGIVIFSMIIAGMILGRLVTDTAQRGLEANAQRAEKALDETRRQAAELTQRAAELVEQNDQQRRLLDLVATLETPAVTLANGVLLAPVVGHLDSRRAQDLTSRLLQDVSALRAQLVVLDIAGVSTIDTEVAQALLKAAQALRLLGCRVTITGISASVAATMTTLGISMEGVTTARTPQEALERYMNALRSQQDLPNNRAHMPLNH